MVVSRAAGEPMPAEHMVKVLQITGAALGIPAAAAGTFAAYQKLLFDRREVPQAAQ
jgi:hypothetical protein